MSQNREITSYMFRLVMITIFALVVEESVGVLVPGDGLDLDAEWATAYMLV